MDNYVPNDEQDDINLWVAIFAIICIVFIGLTTRPRRDKKLDASA